MPADYVAAYPGSSEPLHYSVLAFTSPAKSYVTADPGYEAGMHAAGIAGRTRGENSVDQQLLPRCQSYAGQGARRWAVLHLHAE